MALLPMELDDGVVDIKSGISGIYSGVVNVTLFKFGHLCILNFYVPSNIAGGSNLMTLPVTPVYEEAVTFGNATFALGTNGKVVNYGSTTAVYVQIVFPTNS